MAISHKRQAEKILESVERNGGNDKAHLTVLLASAQVHATLAMAELLKQLIDEKDFT